MASKHHISRPSSSSTSCRSTTILTLALLLTSFLLFVTLPSGHLHEPFLQTKDSQFYGDLREMQFPWNKLCFGPAYEKLKLAVFSKTWPIGADPGGMERHASTLYTFLASRGHEVHVFTVPSDRKTHPDIHNGNLHVHFAANDHGSVNCSLAFEIFNHENKGLPFDYVHTESVSLPHWRAKMVPKVAVTWHGIWYEIMYSKLFQRLLSPDGSRTGSDADLREAMPRLVDEINFFPSFDYHSLNSLSREYWPRIQNPKPQATLYFAINNEAKGKP